VTHSTAAANEIPAGIEVQSIWVVEASYTPEAAERRRAVRAEHLTRIAGLIRDGVIIEAGGCLDLSTAILLVRAENEEAALDLMRHDIYLAAGVLTDLRARPFGRVVPTE